LVWAKGIPLEHVWLKTREANARARRVFTRCGFRPCSVMDGWIKMVYQVGDKAGRKGGTRD
jgi:RimJ/RimL family protein N-acetyltransferase